MANGINFEPFRTQGSFQNGFNVESRGLVQGDAQADPAVRLQLCSGWLPNDLDTPIFGGLPISESITQVDMNVAGSTIRNATTRVDGFCVFNQAYHGIITAGNNVPQYLPGGTIHYYRLGSLARIPLPISPGVLALNEDGTEGVSQTFVWDTENLYVDLQTPGTGGEASTDTRLVLPIKCLYISPENNMTISRDENQSVIWEYDAPAATFMI